MNTLRAANKTEAGRLLGMVNSQLMVESSRTNRIDTILLLLCLEDAINNLEINFLRSKLKDYIEKEKRDVFVLSIFQFISEWYHVMNTILNAITEKNSFVPPRIRQLPQFSFGITLQQNIDDYLIELFKQGEIGAKDWVLKKPRYFLNRIPGWFFIVIKGGKQKSIEKNLNAILKLRDLYYKQGLLETMLYIAPEGTTVEFDDTTGLRKITLPGGDTVESALEREGITPRIIENHTLVFDWNSFFRETAAENFKIVDMGKGKENLKILRREDKEIYRAYSSIKNYSYTFKQFFGIDLQTFFEITSEITYLCYKNIHSIGSWKYSDLFRERELLRFGRANVEKTIRLLTRKFKSSFLGFISVNGYTFTSFRRLTVSRLILLEKCFGELLNNDFKGDAFEGACRRVMREQGLHTIPNRVEINESTIPPEVAYSLWGKLKEKTDIDVISSKNNCLLIIECKEIKDRALERHKLKHFKQFCFEHFYRAKWIKNNLNKFESYIGNDLGATLAVDKTKPVFILPFLVTNIAIQFEELMGTTLISFLELKEMVSNQDFRIEESGQDSGILEININQRQIRIPWLLAKELGNS